MNKVLISETFFSHSYSTQKGGSIYVFLGSCIQYRVCSINSKIPKDTDNEYIYGCHSCCKATKENYIIESSISKSTGRNACVYLEGGRQLIDSTNISYAECTYNAAYVCSNFPSSHKINFTSIFNNTANNYCVMGHWELDQYVLRCNVISNTLDKNGDSEGIIWHAGYQLLNLSFCVISSNSGKYLFRNGNGQCVVYKCYFDNKDVDKTASKSNEVDPTTTKHFVIKFSHLSTQECEFYFPLIETRERNVSYAKNPYQNHKYFEKNEDNKFINKYFKIIYDSLIHSLYRM